MANSIAQTNVKLDILEALQNESVSRVKLAKNLGLSKPTISEHVSKLIDLGIIQEIGMGSAKKTGGRKPIILELNNSYQYVITVDLSVERPICAIGNLNYQLINEKEVSLNCISTIESRLKSVTSTIENLLDSSHLSIMQVGAIIISTPGIIGEDGDYYFANQQFSKWTQIGLKRHLELKYQLPVLMYNDVNLALIAEMEIGNGREYNNMIYVSCGLGMGSSIALNRQIYEGEHFAAGEIGYFIDESSIETGTNIEDLICLNGVLKKIRTDLHHGQQTMLRQMEVEPDELGFEHIVKAYEMNDAYIKSIFSNYIGTKLGITIFNIVSLLDLGIVIFGGIYASLSDEIFKGMKQVTSRIKIKEPKLETSKFGAKGSTYGAMIMGAKKILKVATEQI